MGGDKSAGSNGPAAANVSLSSRKRGIYVQNYIDYHLDSRTCPTKRDDVNNHAITNIFVVFIW